MKISTDIDAIERLERICKQRLTDHDGVITRWREFGSGTPLILLHGGHGSWLHWIRNIEALSASHRVLVPDMPGYGDSGSLPAGSGFTRLVDEVTGSIDELLGAGAHFDLAGFSFGGLIAGSVALRQPGVRRLALLGAVGHGLRRRQSAPMLGWRDAKDETTMLAHLRHNLGILMLHGPVDPLALEIHRRSCLRTRYRNRATSRTPILSQALEQLEIPVLMLWGEHDATAYPNEVGCLWKGERPNRTYEVIPSAGHWVQYEAANEVNGRLLDWFLPY